VQRLTKIVYVLAFGVLTFAMRSLGEPSRTALVVALGAVGYAGVVALVAQVVNAIDTAPRVWRAALMLIAGTGFATFLFPLPQLAIAFGLVFCGLDVAKHLRPAGVPLPADPA
jgi:peptidoglycan/LPS O-acetylase OafA/YrhL